MLIGPPPWLIKRLIIHFSEQRIQRNRLFEVWERENPGIIKGQRRGAMILANLSDKSSITWPVFDFDFDAQAWLGRIVGKLCCQAMAHRDMAAYSNWASDLSPELRLA